MCYIFLRITIRNTSMNKNLLLLHATVLIWGFTGVLGNLIATDTMHLVWYRVMIAFVSLGVYIKTTGGKINMSKKDIYTILGTGAIVALHWFFFFESIKSSTVSVGLVCLSSVTLFTAILEPLINRTSISKLEIGIGASIVMGLLMIFKFETQYTLGISLGILAALSASIFSIINGRLVKRHDATQISFIEMGGAAIWINTYHLLTGGFNSSMLISKIDLFYLLVLGIVCTAVAYVVAVSVMKELSAFRVALATNLEPVYGIILAFIIFGKKEQMSGGFYVGACIVLGAVFLYPYIKTGLEKHKERKLLRNTA